MQLSRYSFKTNESYLEYEFISTGPRGLIKKVVRFTQIGTGIFNLSFGDLNEETGEISDRVITNNFDSRKVLTTVAAIVHDFTLHYPAVWIIAKGSTHSRTRLYRMGISNNWQEISMDFEMYGLEGYMWELFEPGRDYSAYLVRRK